MQLDLFADAPVFYHRALEALGRLDPEGCAASLAEHVRRFPQGPDPAPVEAAAAWLDSALPQAREPTVEFGRRALAACRALREGRAAGFPGLGGATGRAAARTLAGRGLERARAEGVDLSSALADGLPWGILLLWVDRPSGAQVALEGFLSRHEPSAAAYLALADALVRQRREHAALVACREGYLADPEGGGWPTECLSAAEARARYAGDPEWGPEWWAVGAYLEGFFPRFGAPSVEEVRRRWERFRGLRERWGAGEPLGACLFGAGVLLAENTEASLASGCVDLMAVRRTLQEANPAAWTRLRDALGAEGPRRR